MNPQLIYNEIGLFFYVRGGTKLVLLTFLNNLSEFEEIILISMGASALGYV